ncbi:hypothetical protein N0V83_005562 [Neocucurbitaria cava]|uniref:Transcription factor domain-containing protein n=1 Tax=Neocucurbitaria cava TaxID=798079 RepID=A0A9W8Y9Z1_9PLEO|nr:hypothetical protein N0V83_005562 [Neocucurbitaria cava]
MGADVESVLRHVKDADLLIQLTLVPETRRRYTLPYSSSMPALLLVPDNPYFSSPLYEAPFEQASTPSSSGSSIANSEQYFKPHHAAEIVEPLLDHVCAKDWTTIVVDDGLFRRLISVYLLHQHLTFYQFNKDLFLEDMAARRTMFCSPLLHAYKGIADLNKFWLPENLQTRLLLEIERLWKLEEGKSCLTTIHAAMVLYNVHTSNAMDREGRFYTLQAITMANELRIFDQAPAHMKIRLQRGREYTAWGLWSWQVSDAYYFRRAPDIKKPPSFAPPDPATDPSWYGEIYLRYPLSSRLTPIHYGHLFNATIGLRKILNDLALLLYDDQAPTELSNEQLLDIVARFDHWMNDLPSSLNAQNISHPAQIQLHAEYYMTLHNLIQSHAAKGSDFFGSDRFYNGQSAVQTQNNAHIRFETLMRLWCLRHGFSSYDAWVSLFLTYLGNLALNSLEEDGPETGNPSSSTREFHRSTVWPLPNIKIVDNPDSASLNNLLKELRDLTMTTQQART